METNKILTGDICILVSEFNKSKCVSNKSVFHKSISDNSKRIQNALITGDRFGIMKLL